LLSKKRRGEPKVIASICGSCHLRGGQSKAKGFPYAFHFVPGDDLFADYRADFAKADDATLNAGDRHVYRTIPDVLHNYCDLAFLAFHAVHHPPRQKPRRVPRPPACLDCHNATGPKKDVKAWKVSSALCEY